MRRNTLGTSFFLFMIQKLFEIFYYYWTLLELIDILGNNSEAEAKHLVFEADEDQDSKLTKEEILNNYDLFVGSQVVNNRKEVTIDCLLH